MTQYPLASSAFRRACRGGGDGRFRKNLLPYLTEYVILTYELVITNQKEK